MTSRAETVELTGLVHSLASGGSWILRVESGADAGKELRLSPQKRLVGAGRECALVLTDKTVSREHASVQLGERGVVVVDLDSTNGTFTGSTRVSHAEIANGGVILFGDTAVRVCRADAPRLPPSERTRFGALSGKSTPMREVFAILELAASADASVLIQGPSGTGKELAARALHDFSNRAAKPFVVFDCGALSTTLLQSALLGHKKGSFTGADKDRPGVFVAASGGTLFIDEVGELPLLDQTSLLRVLESHEVTPVGAEMSRKVDVRVVAASHRDLAAMVDAGEFRLDLYHRLAVIEVRMPALADHLDDLPVLIERFYESRSIEPGPIVGPNLEALRAHPFAGNVRELGNLLERSFVLSGGAAQLTDLQLWIAPPGRRAKAVADLPFKEAKLLATDAFEAGYLPDLMERFAGNLTHAAEYAGLSRRHLRALLVKHGLRQAGE